MENTLSHEFFTALGLFNKNLKNHHPKIKLHHGEYMMLGAIHGCTINSSEDEKSQGVSVSELSEKIHATKPAASKMLNALEDKGYIKRTMSSTDRRVVYISLTDLGHSIIGEAIDTMRNTMNKALNSLGEEDARQLIVLMNKVNDALCEQSVNDNAGNDNAENDNNHKISD